MKRIRRVNRKAVLKTMMELAAGDANDAVKLAYLEREDQALIDNLDLICLTEFKRSANGAVEVKLADRASVLVKLLEQLKEEENGGPAAFIQALDQAGGPA